jgi:integrase/recombinase XerC
MEEPNMNVALGYYSSLQETFLNYLENEKRHSFYTIRAYKTDLNGFQAYTAANGISSLLEVNHHDVRGYLLFLQSQQLVAKSINRKLATLKAFYLLAQKLGWIEKSPVAIVHTLKQPKRIPVFIADSAAQFAVPDKKLGTYAQARQILVCELLVSTGLRLSEAIKLRVEDVDLDRNTLFVYGKGNKTRIVPIHTQLMALIKGYLAVLNETFGVEAGKSTPLIRTDKGEHAYPVLIQRIVAAGMTGIEGVQQSSPHVLRHTFATQLLDNGAPLVAIKDLMGHAGLAATQIYTHSSTERLKAVFKNAHPKGKE